MFCFACGPFGFYAAAQAAAPNGPDGFSNTYSHDAEESFWRWKWERLGQGVPGPPRGGWQFPHRNSDAGALRANVSRPTVTWIGHAAFLIQLAGRNVLVDPHFSARASSVAFAGPKVIGETRALEAGAGGRQ